MQGILNQVQDDFLASLIRATFDISHNEIYNRGMKKELKDAIKYWDYIAPLVAYPKNKKEFEKLQISLEEVLDIIGDNEKHPLMTLADIMGNLIASYEAKHYPAISGTGAGALKLLMEEHKLKQSDLPEIGSQGVISEILNGKRTLNLRQVKLLTKRFNVSHATFIDDKDLNRNGGG